MWAVLLTSMLSLPPLCLTSRQFSTSNLIGRQLAARERIGRQAMAKAGMAPSRLMDLSGDAGFRSVRLSWRLESQAEKKTDEAAENFQIRYCENQVLAFYYYV
jgi:hypothetical protein